MKLFKEIFGVSGETRTDYEQAAMARGAVLRSAIGLAKAVLVDHVANQRPNAPLQHIFQSKGPEAQRAAHAYPLRSAEIPLHMIDQHTLLNTAQEPVDISKFDEMLNMDPDGDIYADDVEAARARVAAAQEDLDLAV